MAPKNEQLIPLNESKEVQAARQAVAETKAALDAARLRATQIEDEEERRSDNLLPRMMRLATSERLHRAAEDVKQAAVAHSDAVAQRDAAVRAHRVAMQPIAEARDLAIIAEAEKLAERLAVLEYEHRRLRVETQEAMGKVSSAKEPHAQLSRFPQVEDLLRKRVEEDQRKAARERAVRDGRIDPKTGRRIHRVPNLGGVVKFRWSQSGAVVAEGTVDASLLSPALAPRSLEKVQSRKLVLR